MAYGGILCEINCHSGVQPASRIISLSFSNVEHFQVKNLGNLKSMLAQGLPGMEQSLLSRPLNFLSSCRGFSYLHHLHLHFLSFSCQRLKTTEGKPHILCAAHVASLINTRIGLSPNGRMNIAIFIGTMIIMILWVMNLTGFAWFCCDTFGRFHQIPWNLQARPSVFVPGFACGSILDLSFFEFLRFLPSGHEIWAMCGFLSSIFQDPTRRNCWI